MSKTLTHLSNKSEKNPPNFISAKISIADGNNKANHKFINDVNNNTNISNLKTGNKVGINESNKKIIGNKTKNTESKNVITNAKSNDNKNTICAEKANSNEKVSSNKYCIKSFNNETNTLNKPNNSFNDNKFGKWSFTMKQINNDKGKDEIKQVNNSNNNDDKKKISADNTNNKQLTNTQEDNKSSVNKLTNDSNSLNTKMQLHKTFTKTDQNEPKCDNNCTSFSFYQKNWLMNDNNNTSNSLSTSKLIGVLNNSINESQSLNNPNRKKNFPHGPLAKMVQTTTLLTLKLANGEMDLIVIIILAIVLVGKKLWIRKKIQMQILVKSILFAGVNLVVLKIQNNLLDNHFFLESINAINCLFKKYIYKYICFCFLLYYQEKILLNSSLLFRYL